MKQFDYNYELPEELIAHDPIEPRDHARLFVYDTAADKVTFDSFFNVGKYLPVNSVLVTNNTKVVPARVNLYKETGGKVEVLFLVNENHDSGLIKALVDRKVEEGQALSFEDKQFQVQVVKRDEKVFTFKLLFPESELIGLLNKYGSTPIPKYLNETTLQEKDLRLRYQSVFAQNPASVAAPTASLHFTDELLAKLNEQGINQAEITLHVGLGTFAPLTEEQIQSGKLHFEKVEIESSKLAQAIKEQKKIISVGTTATRALESFAEKIKVGENVNEETSLFIKKPYQFKIIDGMITNFHLPNSSLMYLVDAFLEHKGAKRNINDLYKIAVQEKFRFFSFGDAMIIV